MEIIDSIAPGNPNVALYQQLFDPKSPKYLNDAQFHNWIERMRNKEGALVYIDPPGSKYALDVMRNINVLGPKYGIEFFQHIWYQDESGDWFLTPNAYLILPFPVRRQAQLLVEKISIPENNHSIDDFTGQVTGDSKGSKISYPELSLLKAFGLKKTIEEFMHWRGGDVKGNRLMNQQILKTGGASMKALEPYAGEVGSTRSLRNILFGMHYDNTL
ncbi:putative RNA polymerase beta subunit [Ralstonia phage RSF1]|uniref:Putative RNA polymerase beta subunit n=1 Tax=Ralstonia phage RSF1 TaxID=1689679 RepID=A0A0K2QQM4_9CAUD|nr:RNA polymerase beta subunit [Ralstonia phage RSF1]BAS04843.2 putative RNA polymerase beta subunit [Ralstonia phage RSF1]